MLLLLNFAPRTDYWAMTIVSATSNSKTKIQRKYVFYTVFFCEKVQNEKNYRIFLKKEKNFWCNRKKNVTLRK